MNYTKVHKKPKCPVPNCKEKLNSVNTYSCKTCGTSVCLKHRFPNDHDCASRSGTILTSSLTKCHVHIHLNTYFVP